MTKPRIVFVHGLDGYGASVWPRQHLLAGQFDALFLKRTGFDALMPPVPENPQVDAQLVLDALSPEGGVVVAHEAGAVAAMLAALSRPDLVKSLVLIEPLVPSLTAELLASSAFRESLSAAYSAGDTLSDEEFAKRLRFAISTRAEPGQSQQLGNFAPVSSEPRELTEARLRLQRPPWEQPISIVPGVKTLVITGGWEPLYEEIAEYLVGTGASHLVTDGGHRPQDTAAGSAAIESFIKS